MELMFESVVLGLLGSSLGLALAYGALRVLVAIAPTSLPRVHEIGIDSPVLLFTLGLALLDSLLLSLIADRQNLPARIPIPACARAAVR